MAGNLDLILEAAKFNASSVSSSEASTTAASLTDSESHLYPNEQEHYSDELEFDREDISSEEGGYMLSGGQPNSRKRFASHDDRTDDDDVNRTKAMESHNENERKRRRGLKSSVLRLREQLTQKTRKPSQISILQAAQDEIQKLKRRELEEEKTLNELRKRNDYLSFYIQKQREKFATVKTSEQHSTLPLTPVKPTLSPVPPLLSPVQQQQQPPPLTPVPPPLTPISSSPVDHNKGGNGNGAQKANETQGDQSTSDGIPRVTYWTPSSPVVPPYTLPLMTVLPQTAVRTSTGYPLYQYYHPSSPFLSRHFTHSLPTVPALLHAPQYSYLPTNTLPHSLSASLSSLPSSSADSTLSSVQSSTTERQVTDSDNKVHFSDQRRDCFCALPRNNSSENYQRPSANVLPLSSPFLFVPLSPSANGCSSHPRLSVNSISRLAAAHQSSPTTQLSNGWHSTLTAASAQ